MSSSVTDEFKDDFDLSDLGLNDETRNSHPHADNTTRGEKARPEPLPDDSEEEEEEILDLGIVGEFLGVASDPFPGQAKKPDPTILDTLTDEDSSLVQLSPTDFVPEENDETSNAETQQKADALLFDFDNVDLEVDDADIEVFEKESSIFHGDDPLSEDSAAADNKKNFVRDTPPPSENTELDLDALDDLMLDDAFAEGTLPPEQPEATKPAPPTKRLPERNQEETFDLSDRAREDFSVPEPETEKQKEIPGEEKSGENFTVSPQKETGGFYPVSDTEDILDIDDLLAAPILPQGFHSLMEGPAPFQGADKTQSEKPAEESFAEDLGLFDIDDLTMNAPAEGDPSGGGPEPPHEKEAPRIGENAAAPEESPDLPDDDTGMDLDELFNESEGKASSDSEPHGDLSPVEPELEEEMDLDELFGDGSESGIPQKEEKLVVSPKSEETREFGDLSIDDLPVDDADFGLAGSDNDAFELGDLDTLILEEGEEPGHEILENFDGSLDLEDDLAEIFLEETSSQDSPAASSPAQARQKEAPGSGNQETEEISDFDASVDTALDFLFGGEDALEETNLFSETEGKEPGKAPENDLPSVTDPEPEMAVYSEEERSDDLLANLDGPGNENLPEEKAWDLEDILPENHVAPKTLSDSGRHLQQDAVDLGSFSQEDSALDFLLEGDGALGETDLLAIEEELAKLEGEKSESGGSPFMAVGRDKPEITEVERQALSAPEDLEAFLEEEAPSRAMEISSGKEEDPSSEDLDALFGELEKLEMETAGISESDRDPEDLFSEEERLSFEEDLPEQSMEEAAEFSLLEEDEPLFGKTDTAVEDFEKSTEKESITAPENADTLLEDLDDIFEEEERLSMEESAPFDRPDAASEEASDFEEKESIAAPENADTLLEDLDAIFKEEEKLSMEESAPFDRPDAASEETFDFVEKESIAAPKDTDTLLEDLDAIFKEEEKLSMEESAPFDRPDAASEETSDFEEKESITAPENADTLLEDLDAIFEEEEKLSMEESAPFDRPDATSEETSGFSDLDLLFEGKPDFQMDDQEVTEVISRVKGEKEFGEVVSQVVAPEEARLPSALEREMVLAVNPPISVSDLETMLEKIVRKVLSEKIDAALVAAVEKAVEKEFKALTQSLYEEEP